MIILLLWTVHVIFLYFFNVSLKVTVIIVSFKISILHVFNLRWLMNFVCLVFFCFVLFCFFVKALALGEDI